MLDAHPIGAQPVSVGQYAELIRAIRNRMMQLEVTYETVEQIAGLQSGYLAKIISNPDADHPKKRLGPYTMFLILGALGMRAGLYEDPEAMALVKSRLIKRRYRLATASRR